MKHNQLLFTFQQEEKAPARDSLMVMVKTGSICNLACDYCFDNCTPPGLVHQADTLRVLFQHTATLPKNRIVFSWHGGEPLVAGVAFFQHALEMQENLRRPDQEIFNSIHTNGLLVDDSWIEFFVRNRVSVSVSLDGPQDFHDQMRKMPNGTGSHQYAIQALQKLRQAGLSTSISVVIRDDSWKIVDALWRLCCDIGVDFIKFWPMLDHYHRNFGEHISVNPKNYLKFLRAMFNVWQETKEQQEQPRVFLFDDLLNLGCGESNLCWFNFKACLQNMVVDPTGGVFPCDSFIGHDQFLMGSILDMDLLSQWDGKQWQDYRTAVLSPPIVCKSCLWVDICSGGCPYQRFLAGGLGNRTYYCLINLFLFSKFIPKIGMLTQ